jgi:thiol-disulfide isomerase/thioredoxin
LLKRVLLAFCLVVLSAGAVAGGFSLKDSKGKVHNLSDYKGKWVLVNFWATWCPPCLDEIPDLIALHEQKNSKVAVIGVAMDYQNSKQVIEFADSMFISYPIVLGNQKMAAQIGPVEGLPTTYLYNPQGKMVAQNVGAVTRAAIENFIAGK